MIAHSLLAALPFLPSLELYEKDLVLMSIVFIGLSQSLYCVNNAPIIKKYCSDEEMPTLMSITKVIEGFALTISIYFTGHLRQTYGSFTSVSLYLILLSLGMLFLQVFLFFTARD